MRGVINNETKQLREATMLFRASSVLACIAAALTVTAIAASSLAHSSGESIRPVLSEKLPNVPGKSISTIVVTYAPGGTSKPHLHAGSVLAFVLSGEIRSENSATGPAKVYKAGEAFFEPPGSKHLISENASKTQPASLLAIFIADDGATLTKFDK